MRRLLLNDKTAVWENFYCYTFCEIFLPELIEDVLNKTFLLNGKEPALVRRVLPPIYFAQPAFALPAGRTHDCSLIFSGPVQVASRGEFRH
jgi:hypothetical protein